MPPPMCLCAWTDRYGAARGPATVRLHVLPANLDQLDEIIERITNEEAGAIVDRLGDPDLVAVFAETGSVRLDVVHFEAKMLRRRVWSQVLLFEDMDLIPVLVGGKPDH